jgi:hypothetical protein
VLEQLADGRAVPVIVIAARYAGFPAFHRPTMEATMAPMPYVPRSAVHKARTSVQRAINQLEAAGKVRQRESHSFVRTPWHDHVDDAFPSVKRT